MTDHPFQPGVKVALVRSSLFGAGDIIEAAEIAKVYKTERVRLVGDAQQYRPEQMSRGSWVAYSTNRNRSRRSKLFVWDAEFDKRMAREGEVKAFNESVARIGSRLGKIRHDMPGAREFVERFATALGDVLEGR